MERSIITIGRQFGSGGREIGQKLAKRFSVEYFDKELLQLAAEQSGWSKECFEKADEKSPGSLMHALAVGLSMTGTAFQYGGGFTDENIFKFQSDTIQKLASDRSCIIVGRCADYILRNHPNCFNIFIHAPLNKRIPRVAQQEHLSERAAMELIKKTDKSRANYYNYYSGKVWGDSASYHLSIDASLAGVDRTVDFIESFVLTNLDIKK